MVFSVSLWNIGQPSGCRASRSSTITEMVCTSLHTMETTGRCNGKGRVRPTYIANSIRSLRFCKIPSFLLLPQPSWFQLFSAAPSAKGCMSVGNVSLGNNPKGSYQTMTFRWPTGLPSIPVHDPPFAPLSVNFRATSAPTHAKSVRRREQQRHFDDEVPDAFSVDFNCLPDHPSETLPSVTWKKTCQPHLMYATSSSTPEFTRSSWLFLQRSIATIAMPRASAIAFK